ncbi:MAG: asparagine synthase (glutamine-hydrolyzing), partial [Gemmatimonadaceae bacterium]|nr:asparagine synthase (glutamine-hydrolyzing) [Gemmatimonadaceae bacterium]
MCGIAGLVGFPTEYALPRVREALRRLEHRGPDGEGIHQSADAVIGMRRLSIIDLQCGDQPIYNEDRSIACVCNGELYNYVEEFKVLRSRGHNLQSGSDINLLPHLYEERGAEAFHDCRGMFAAAVWDEPRRRLILARDRAGKKPLFYAQSGAGIAFASELPALLAMLDRAPAISTSSLTTYLSLGFVPHPVTIYDDVFALPPASTLTFSAGSAPTVRKYWDIPDTITFRGSREAALEILDAKLAEAVSLRLRSDVPVGLFLSGGIDSGLVASYAAQAGARDLLCFVVEVDDPQLNEAPAAHEVASQLGLPIETISLNVSPFEAMDKVSLLYGQPFADSSAIPSYFVAKAAAAHRKVVLTGDGGDEIFAGYRRYWMGKIAPAVSAVPWPLSALAHSAGELIARRTGRRSSSGFAARALRGSGASQWDRYLSWTSDLLHPADVNKIFPGLTTARFTESPIEILRGYDVSTSTVDAFQKSDFGLILADDLLSKMDIATMANSLEARSPFLDIPLAEFAWSIPEKWRNSFGETKSMLRALARTRLPARVSSAPKRGFEVPVKRWMDFDLKPALNDLLLAADSRVAQYADRRQLEDFVQGTSAFAGNLAQSQWTLLMLEIFLRAPQPGRV